MGKPTICICENKDADQLRGNREADQRLCFRYSDSTIPLLFKILNSFCDCTGLYVVCVGPGWEPRRPIFSCRCSFLLRSLASAELARNSFLSTTNCRYSIEVTWQANNTSLIIIIAS